MYVSLICILLVYEARADGQVRLISQNSVPRNSATCDARTQNFRNLPTTYSRAIRNALSPPFHLSPLQQVLVLTKTKPAFVQVCSAGSIRCALMMFSCATKKWYSSSRATLAIVLLSGENNRRRVFDEGLSNSLLHPRMTPRSWKRRGPS